MKRVVFLMLLIPCIVLADEPKLTGLLGATKTNVTVVSQTKSLKARKLFPVMRDEDNNIVNDNGVVGDKLSTDAIDIVSKASAELSESANDAMTNALAYVYEALKDMAKDSVGIAIAFAPDTDVSNLTCYVAHETTDRTNDTFYVWLSEELRLAPNVFMAYEYYAGSVTQKLNWVRGWNTTTNVTDNRGQLWENCHIGQCKRPEWAINVTCITEPNLPIGGPNGMNWGGITLLDEDDGEPYYTGYITNTIDHLIMYCEDGAIKGINSYEVNQSE